MLQMRHTQADGQSTDPLTCRSQQPYRKQVCWRVEGVRRTLRANRDIPKALGSSQMTSITIDNGNWC